MAEALGAVAAVVGVLSSIATLYDSCVKGYAMYTDARHLEKTYATLFMKLRIQEARFHIWGRGWAIQGPGRADQVAVSEGLRKIVEDVLQQLSGLLRDSAQMSAKYGVREAEDNMATEAPVSNGVQGPGQESAVQTSQAGHSAEPEETTGKTRSLTRNLRKKARWAISDKEKFEALVTELRYFNDSLYDILPLQVRQYLQRDALPSEMLRTDDCLELRTIFDAASGSYDLLAQCANIRNLVITDRESAGSSFTGRLSSSMLKIHKTEIELEGAEMTPSASGTEKRILAFYNASQAAPMVSMGRRRVLIEWRSFDKDAGEDFAHVLYSRIENLARLLHPATLKPSSLGTLDCLGFYPDYIHSRYGFVYSLPKPDTTPTTLQKLLIKSSASPSSARPDLGARFGLAQRIARSLLQLHASGWLHKSLSSANLLVFVSEKAPQTSTGNGDGEETSLEAWITGFDYARPDDLREPTEKAAADPAADMYRHRLVLEGVVRYRRAFDIYSLGLILLEIGLWSPLRDIYKAKYSYETFKLRLERFHYPLLAFAAGKTYESVVRRCLDDGLNGNVQGSTFAETEISTQDTFCWELVKDLEKCCV